MARVARGPDGQGQVELEVSELHQRIERGNDPREIVLLALVSLLVIAIAIVLARTAL